MRPAEPAEDPNHKPASLVLNVKFLYIKRVETFAEMNFPPAESAAGPGAEHPDSILSGGEQRINSDTHGGRDARKKSRLNPAATDSHKPGREGGREGGRESVDCATPQLSQGFFVFFFPSTYPLHTTSRRFAL